MTAGDVLVTDHVVKIVYTTINRFSSDEKIVIN